MVNVGDGKLVERLLPALDLAEQQWFQALVEVEHARACSHECGRCEYQSDRGEEYHLLLHQCVGQERVAIENSEPAYEICHLSPVTNLGQWLVFAAVALTQRLTSTTTMAKKFSCLTKYTARPTCMSAAGIITHVKENSGST